MKRIHWSVLLSVAVLAAFVIGANGLGAKPTRVGVCEIRRLLVEYQRFADLRQALETQDKNLAEEMKKRTDVIVELGKQMSELKKGSPDHQKLEELSWQKTFEARAFQDVQKGRLERQQHQGLLACYADIVREIEAYAKDSGIDVVYSTRDVNVEEAMNVKELESVIASKYILYRAAELDVTDAVIARLNAAYQPAKKTE